MSGIPTPHRIEDATALFDGLFADTFRTRLLPGGGEPLYLPANDDCAYHRVIFAHGFFASALHEASHWCIAGSRRRALEDYGYWYLPDGRDARQQHDFEVVEAPPQALELLFSRACGLRFHVSVDNLGEVAVDRDDFRARVEARAERYEREGLPQRAEAFRVALDALYRQCHSMNQAVALGRARLSSTTPEASIVV